MSGAPASTDEAPDEPQLSGRALDRKILGLALPVLAMLAADPLYELTDAVILARLGSDEVAGWGVAVQLLGLGWAIFIFLMFGTTAWVARLSGANREDEATSAGVQAMWLGVVIGTIAALVQWPLASWLVGLFGADPAVTESAELYFTVSLLGIPAFLIVLAGNGFLRGRQNTLTPLWVALFAVCLNLVIEVIAIFGLGYGVGASALSTVIAKWAAALILAAIVIRAARRRSVGLGPVPRLMRRLGATGLPLFIRTVALRVTMAVAIAVASRISGAALAGYAIAFQIWMTMAYVMDGLEVAGQTLVGHSLGAGHAEHARVVGARIIVWATGIGVVIAAVLALAAPAIGGVFTDDAAVAAIVVSSLYWVALMQPINGATFALDGILVGAGDLRFLAVAMSVATAIFIPIAWWIGSNDLSLDWLWASLTLFMLCRIVALGIRFRGRRWQRTGALTG
jgi:putative MATE family efflux protein